MPLTHTMQIDRLEKINSGELFNAVLRVVWTRTTAKDNGVSLKTQGLTIFNQSKIDPNSFIPYESLTEAKVIEWVMADPQITEIEELVFSMNPTDAQLIECNASYPQIERLETIIVNPFPGQETVRVSSESFPWNTASRG